MNVGEPIYTFEIARRSVGRAAYHLGIDTISEGALDVLADVLLNYLNRVGRTLSHLVESSGRTSSHVNILDALHACELVALPAVERLHLRDGTDATETLFAGTGATTTSSSSNSNNHKGNNNNNNTTTTTTRTHLSSDWQGLATFLFGPKWLSTSTNNNDDEEDGEGSGELRQSNQNAGGKVGPSVLEPQNMKKKQIVGWDAPYLDEVQPFPIASEKCANPHSLSSHSSGRLTSSSTIPIDTTTEAAEEEMDSTEAELDFIPDTIFATTDSWGGIQNNNKRKATSVLDDTHHPHKEDVTMTDVVQQDGGPSSSSTLPPPRKKVKFDGPTATAATATTATTTTVMETIDLTQKKEREIKAMLHIPSFYPVPPVFKSSSFAGGSETERTVIVDNTTLATNTTTTTTTPQHQTPSTSAADEAQSIVDGSKLVRSSLVHMGNYYWGSGWNTNTTSSDVDGRNSLVVPLGRNSNEILGSPSDLVIPVGRASGSRVSRILEGSMDAAAMQ